MHNRKTVTKVLYHVFVILFGFMMVYPVLWMISGSFKGNAEILRGTLSLIPKELKLTNYATGWKGFGGTTFATFFTNSIFITVIATFGTVISSSLVAYALSRVRFRGRKFWFTCMLVTMMLPTQVIMIPQYLIYYRLGLVPGYVPLILPYFCGQAFFIYQMMQFMQGIPKDLDEAATIDGCSKYQIYSRIILPLMKPSIVTTVIIQFYWKWDDYMGPLLYLSRPQSYTVSIAIKLFADSASTTDYGAMFAMSTLSLIPVFLIFLFFNRYLVQGIGTSGLKGLCLYENHSEPHPARLLPGPLHDPHRGRLLHCHIHLGMVALCQPVPFQRPGPLGAAAKPAARTRPDGPAGGPQLRRYLGPGPELGWAVLLPACHQRDHQKGPLVQHP